MALKFNPFTGTLDYTAGTEGSSGFVTLAEPIQTIIQLKKFEPPTALTNSLAIGNSGSEALKVVAAMGGVTQIKTTGTGGKGGPLILKSGEGGGATEAATSSTGGDGGTIEVVSGFGGSGGVAAGVKAKGGAGGKLIISSGGGGSASEGTEVDTGGEGGLYELKAGLGGSCEGVTGTTHTAGAGGKFVIKAGEGGHAAEGVTNNGGAGGSVEILAGKAGTGVGSTPKGGAFIIASGAGAAAAQNGAIEVKTGATVRITVAAEGLTTIKNGLTTEGTLTLPNESVTPKFLKVGVPEAEKELKAATKIKGIAGVSTMVYLSAIFKAEETEGEVIADGKKIYAIQKQTFAAGDQLWNASFKMKAGAEFELKLAKGALEGTTSIYVLQEG